MGGFDWMQLMIEQNPFLPEHIATLHDRSGHPIGLINLANGGVTALDLPRCEPFALSLGDANRLRPKTVHEIARCDRLADEI